MSYQQISVDLDILELRHADLETKCKNVRPWWGKADPQSSGSLPAPQSGYATAIMFYFLIYSS